MKLKRLYKDGKVSGIQIKRFPTNGRQHLSEKIVAKGIAEGWLSINDETVTIHDQVGDLDMNILRKPGRYCCHCGEKLEDDDHLVKSGEAARAHVVSMHKGKKSPDPENPAGYLKLNYFDCVVVK